MTFSYSGNPADSPSDAVRYEIQDILNTNFLLQDEEISYSILQESGTEPSGGYSAAQILSAAAHCCETLVRRFSAQADTQVGTLRITYAKQAQNYLTMAQALRARAQGMQGPYVGGLSRSEKQGILQDQDRVQPAFTRREFDSPWTGQQGNGLDQADLGPPLGT